jgi:hypothetical protein
LIVRDDFVQRLGGAAHAAVRCELDVWSPMSDREAPSVITETGFTLVTAMEVVEHLYHPEWMFRMLSDVMAPGGILFLTTNNAARWGNILGMIRGNGMAGNLDELLPKGGGKLGAWRPHAREYVWRELNNVASKCGFVHVRHGFYEENYNRQLLDAVESPVEDVAVNDPRERTFLDAMRPLLKEPDQLKSGMYLILKKAGRVTRGIRRLRSGLHQVYRETGLQNAVEKRVVKWALSRRSSDGNGK